MGVDLRLVAHTHPTGGIRMGLGVGPEGRLEVFCCVRQLEAQYLLDLRVGQGHPRLIDGQKVLGQLPILQADAVKLFIV